MGVKEGLRRKEDEMRRGFGIAALVLAILVGVAIGVAAYHAGETHGLAEATNGGQAVRVVGPGYGYGWGFFPFGLFLFPLFFFAVFALFRGALWGRWHGHDHPHDGPGPWTDKGPGRFEDWHRRQHEQASGDHPGSGGEPSGA
jgi:hypothetical protein